MAEVKVTNIEVKPRWPWNGLVDIIYSIECDEIDDDGNPMDVYVDFTAIDGDLMQEIDMVSLTGEGANFPVKDGGPYMVTWDATMDAPNFHSSDLKVQIHAIAGIPPYLVINLQTWKRRYSSQPPNLENDKCRTTELWLRCIPAGMFIMGAPEDEVGHYNSDMVPHEVTISEMFFIGVFECTQKQWELVMGSNPSNQKGDCRPVEQVSYDMIRGTGSNAGAGWPTYGHTVDGSSFMGKLQKKTGLVFDLPTEAQRQYACRAGTTTTLYSGKNLTSPEQDSSLSELARYRYNQSDGKGGYTSGHTKVGSYLPNAWGLYDMYGNADEWCLDWWGASTTSTEAETNPVGPRTGSSRVVCCGGWDGHAYDCRSASRGNYTPSNYNIYFGFRIAYHP